MIKPHFNLGDTIFWIFKNHAKGQDYRLIATIIGIKYNIERNHFEYTTTNRKLIKGDFSKVIISDVISLPANKRAIYSHKLNKLDLLLYG